jgi:hypothetical protein
LSAEPNAAQLAVTTSLQRLVRELLEHECLLAGDAPVIKGLVYKLEIQASNLVEVNEKIEIQVGIEADMLYLLSKYRRYLTEDELSLDIEEAQTELDHRTNNAEKMTVREVKASVTTEPMVALGRSRCSAKRDFWSIILWLSKMVFARDLKLKELATNYRRELRLD